MSADNGIYIAKFPDGYRVAHAQAIEDVDYYPEGSTERKGVLKLIFGKSEVYATLEEARTEAYKKEAEILDDDFCPILEYGVCEIGEFESFN